MNVNSPDRPVFQAQVIAPDTDRGDESIPVPPPVPDRKTEAPDPIRRRVLKGILALAATVGIAYGASQVEPVKSFLGLGDQKGSLAPTPDKPNPSWLVLTDAQIQEIAKKPREISKNIIIGDRYLETVNSSLQEKARKLDYTITYQGDPKDTTGRTVLTKNRSITEGASENFGWTYVAKTGEPGGTATLIFKAWIPDPGDPKQQERIYALLENPISKTQCIVSIGLWDFNKLDSFNPLNQFGLGLASTGYPAFFYVDNLDYGPEYIRTEAKKVGGYLQTYDVPDPEDPSSKKGPIDYPFYKLLRVKGNPLTKIAKPGDYVHIGLQIANEQGSPIIKDKRGVGRAMTFIVRRFGGFKAWENEPPA